VLHVIEPVPGNRYHPRTLSASALAGIAGAPERLVREAAERGAFDLLMIGIRGHGRSFEFFVGSVAQRILAELPCDALFVREAHLQPAPGAVAHPDEPESARGPG
jgi:hypothetical protein